MRVCETCQHPDRAEIDKRLATGVVVKRRLAAQKGLSEQSIRRHEANHLDPKLIAAHERLEASEAKSSVLTARQVVLDLVHDIRGIAESMKINGKVHYAKDFLEVADRLVRANEQYGKITKELGSDQVNALFINLGVKSQEELESRLAVTRQAEEAKPDQVVLEACEVLEKVWRTHPELRTLALNRLNESSYALEVNHESQGVSRSSTNGSVGHDAGS